MKNATFLSLAASLLFFTACAQTPSKPASPDNIAVCKQAHKLFSENKFDEVANLVTDNIQVVNYATVQTFNGKAEFLNFMSGFKTAFPDLVIKHTNVFQGDNGYVALEFEAFGTHSGPLAGPGGVIPPTGKSVKFIVCEVQQVIDGKIASIHNYQDSGSLMRQLGLMPMPDGGAPK